MPPSENKNNRKEKKMQDEPWFLSVPEVNLFLLLWVQPDVEIVQPPFSSARRFKMSQMTDQT